MSEVPKTASQRLSRQILTRVLLLGIVIVSVATVICYYVVYNQTKDRTFAYLRSYMLERRQQENRTFLDASERLAFFREEFLKLYVSDLDFTDDDFWKVYFVDPHGATRMKEEHFKERIDASMGRQWGVTSFIGNNQSVASHEFKRRLLIANLLVSRYGPAWTSVGMLHATFPENAMTIYCPDDPWGLKARPDLPMNELGTIKATLQPENPARKPVWTGLYYDETAGKWTITFETPVDYQGRHLVNPSLDVTLEAIMRRLDADHPEGAYNFIVSKSGYLIAHPGELKAELQQKGQLSLDKLGDKDIARMHRVITEAADASPEDVTIAEDKKGGNYLVVTPLAGPDWWFVTVYPRALIAAEADKTSQIVLILGFSLFVLFYLAVHFVVKRHVKIPLQRLQRAVSLVAHGEYQEVIGSPRLLPTEQQNEIGQLAGLFSDMCRDLQDAHSNLQQIVESRTRELETANAKLRDLSLLDGLTGIHNRRSFDRDIAAVFRQAQGGVESFFLMLADVDFFKHYNDVYGHTAGDEALRNISEAIAGSIRKEDRVYRYGGEEIAVIFNTADRNSARQYGSRIIDAVREIGVVHEGVPHGRVTISAGLVEYDARFETVTTLIDAADARLYEAKSSGKDCLRIGLGDT